MGSNHVKARVVTLGKKFRLDLLSLLLDPTMATSPLDTLLLHWVTDSPITADGESVLADFAISGLAAAGVAVNLGDWIGPGISVNESCAIRQQIESIAGVAPTEETLTGAIVVNTADDPDSVAMVFAFVDDAGSPVGIPITEQFDFVSLDAAFALQEAQLI